MKTIKNITIGISVILFFFIVNSIAILPFEILNIDYNKLPMYIKTIYLVFYDITIITVLFLIYLKRIKNDFTDFKKNNIYYLENYIKYWFIALGLMILSNALIMFFTDSIAGNQEAINELFNKNPFYIFFSAVLIAPITEEIVFRLSFRYIFKNDWLFIIMSGLSFGFIHILSAESILNELIFLIPYSIPGMIFAYVLVKSKNIFVPIGLHFIHNGFLMSLKVLSLIIGV